MLTGCCIACTCATLSSSCRSPSPTPSNAVERCCRHRKPLPPPPLNAVSIVHRCLSCCPSPLSNANSHLHPSPLSNADTRCCHPSPLMSISIVASSSPIRSPHRRRRRRTLPPPLNTPPPPPLNTVFIVHRHHCHCHRHCHRRRHLHCQLPHCRTLTKKEAAPPPPPVNQRQHHREHLYKSRLFNLYTVFEV